jgi:hypothetical protein
MLAAAFLGLVVNKIFGAFFADTLPVIILAQ